MDAETERILNMTSQSAFRDFFSSGHNAFAAFEAARDAALSRAQKLKSENALLRDQNGSLEGMLANSRKTAQELLKENLAFKEGVMKNEKLVNQVIEANVQIEAEAARQVASAEAEATKQVSTAWAEAQEFCADHAEVQEENVMLKKWLKKFHRMRFQLSKMTRVMDGMLDSVDDEDEAVDWAPDEEQWGDQADEMSQSEGPVESEEQVGGEVEDDEQHYDDEDDDMGESEDTMQDEYR